MSTSKLYFKLKLRVGSIKKKLRNFTTGGGDGGEFTAFTHSLFLFNLKTFLKINSVKVRDGLVRGARQDNSWTWDWDLDLEHDHYLKWNLGNTMTSTGGKKYQHTKNRYEKTKEVSHSKYSEKTSEKEHTKRKPIIQQTA